MTAPQSPLQTFETRDAASKFVADRIAEIIGAAIETRGEAVILLSGGSTPRGAYTALAGYDFPWEKVRIGLVDDRCVGEGDPGSNQAMIKAIFKDTTGETPQIEDMVPSSPMSPETTADVNTRMEALTQHVDLCLMGMGTDGHTASWFPGSKGLQSAMDIGTTETVAMIDAAGCPVAGEYTDRITLTLPVVMRARHMILFITGDEKAQVFADAATKSVTDAPVKALLAAGPRLLTIWAP